MAADDGPNVPVTPSSTINKMLHARCGKKYDNVVKGAIAYYICGFFHVITTFYNAINPDANRHSHKLWMTACTVISSLIVLKAYLLYNIIMASAFVMHTLLYYGAMSLGLFGVGLGVSGAMFFDKDGAKEKKPEVKRPTTPAPAPPAKKFPEGAKFVPDKVRSFEAGPQPSEPSAPAPAAPAPATPAPVTPPVTSPPTTTTSSGTHGTPSPAAEIKPAEEKKAD